MILRATRTSDGADYSVPVRLSILGTYEPRCYELRWGYFQSKPRAPSAGLHHRIFVRAIRVFPVQLVDNPSSF